MSSHQFTDWLKSNKYVLVGTAAILSGSAVALYYMNEKSKEKTTEDEILRLESFDQFGLPTRKLRQLIDNFHSEMDRGLRGDKSSLKMLPSFVAKPSGSEKGSFYALDLGGTNFRVIRLDLHGERTLGSSNKMNFTISQDVMSGSAEQLFDFIANCVETFIASENKGTSTNATISLGFTFSFPVNQLAINSGELIQWTKGFSTTGVVGKDVVQLLDAAFKRRNKASVQIVALVNDTVGTMVARSYQDPKCEMGVILGTGTNACYYEQLSKITKFKGTPPKGSDGMIINMEWGAFGDDSNILPLTKMDKQLDEASLNPGKQKFEKMISGMYLGEIVRLILVDLLSKGRIFVGTSSLKGKFETADITRVLNDQTNDLTEVAKLLSGSFGITNTSQDDRELLKGVCRIVSNRAARLSAAAIAAVTGKINKLNSTVAVDGSVFQFIPGFRQKMEDTLKELYPESNINLVLTSDGSGNGAAMIAATVAK